MNLCSVILAHYSLTLLKWTDEQGCACAVISPGGQGQLQMDGLLPQGWAHHGAVESMGETVPERCHKVLAGSDETNDYPPTWDRVCTLLEDVKSSEDAKILKIALSSPTDFTSS